MPYYNPPTPQTDPNLATHLLGHGGRAISEGGLLPPLALAWLLAGH